MPIMRKLYEAAGGMPDMGGMGGMGGSSGSSSSSSGPTVEEVD